jgi:hypothetical protein
MNLEIVKLILLFSHLYGNSILVKTVWYEMKTPLQVRLPILIFTSHEKCLRCVVFPSSPQSEILKPFSVPNIKRLLLFNSTGFSLFVALFVSAWWGAASTMVLRQAAATNKVYKKVLII